MDLTFTAQQRALAEQFRAWLSVHKAEPAAPGQEFERDLRWQAELAADRWVAIDWPGEYGGRGASPVEVALCNLEYGRSGAPQLVNRVGLNLTGPTLLAWGTQAQRARWLPRILDASEIWCQLFSEPSAGSDLAALRTTARPVDGGWTLTGQKIWTSYAQHSRWGLCLARTGTGRRQHSLLAVDLHTPGIQIRPIRQITGEAEFNEVFLDGAFVPGENLIGPVDRGWDVAATTLAHERGTGFPVKEQTVHERHLGHLLRLIGPTADHEYRHRLAASYVRLRLLTLSNLATLGRLANGQPPGPESSIVKLQWTALTQDMSRLWLDIAPDDAAAQRQFLWSFVSGIAGGTSEIQRTIIGERILGLPREPTRAARHQT